MALLTFLFLTGALVGVVAWLILRQEGYALFGEIMLGILGSAVVGMFVGVVYGIPKIAPEKLLSEPVESFMAAAPVTLSGLIGALLVLAAVVYVTLRTKVGEAAPTLPPAAAPSKGAAGQR